MNAYAAAQYGQSTQASARVPARALLACLAVLALVTPGCRGADEAADASGGALALGRSAQYDYDPPEPGSYRLPVLQPASGGAVLDAGGEPHELRDLFRDRVTVLSFIYTRCKDPSACPMASGVLGTIQAASEEDPELAANLRLVTFSFDPEHDTPRVMAEYGERIGSTGKGASEWLFLTTQGTDELAPILEAYGQRVDRRKDADDPMGPLFHMVRVYLIDRHANVRNIYSFGMLDPRLLLADVRTLLLEEKAKT